MRLRAVAGPDDLNTMRTAWTRAMRGEASADRGANDGPSGLDQDPAFLPCLEHPQVMGAVAHLLDGDLVLLRFRGREPRAGGGQQGFHVDDAQPVPPDRQVLANAFWILDDMDETNGATRVIPGSHRLGRMPGRELLSKPEARHPSSQTLTARAGDVIVFSGHLWHAGSRNHSGARRRIAMAHFGRREIVGRYGGADQGGS